MKLKEILENSDINPPNNWGWTGMSSLQGNVPSLAGAADDEQQTKLGTYIALVPSLKTKQKLRFFCEDNGVQNMVDQDDLHCTLVKSLNFLPGFTASGTLAKPIIGYNLQCELFKKKGKEGTRNILVLCMDSPGILQRRAAILQAYDGIFKEQKAGEDFIPHITLSYDLGDVDVDLDLLSYNVTRYLDFVEFDSEYEEPLNVEGNGDQKKK